MNGSVYVDIAPWIPKIESLFERPEIKKRKQLVETFPMLEQLSKLNLPAETLGPMVKSLLTYQESPPYSWVWPSTRKESQLLPTPYREVKQPPQLFTGAEHMYEPPATKEGFAPYSYEHQLPPVRREDWSMYAEPDLMKEAQRKFGLVSNVYDLIQKESEERREALKTYFGFSDTEADRLNKAIDIVNADMKTGTKLEDAVKKLPGSLQGKVAKTFEEIQKLGKPPTSRPYSIQTFQGWHMNTYPNEEVPKAGPPLYAERHQQWLVELGESSGAKRKPEDEDAAERKKEEHEAKMEGAKQKRIDALRRELEALEKAAMSDYNKYTIAHRGEARDPSSALSKQYKTFIPEPDTFQAWLGTNTVGKKHNERINKVKVQLYHLETGKFFPPPIGGEVQPPPSTGAAGKGPPLPRGIPQGSVPIGKDREGHTVYKTLDGRKIADVPALE